MVTDYKMPKMNGIELIGRLRKLHPATAVILISGFTDTLGLDEASTGADMVLQKSNNEVSQLVRAVNRLLRKQPPQEADRLATRRENREAESSLAAVRLIFARSFQAIDDEKLHGTFGRFEFQSQLFLNGGEY